MQTDGKQKLMLMPMSGYQHENKWLKKKNGRLFKKQLFQPKNVNINILTQSCSHRSTFQKSEDVNCFGKFNPYFKECPIAILIVN